jgi:hypothetical protein
MITSRFLQAHNFSFVVQSSSENLEDRNQCLLRNVWIRLNNAEVDLLNRHHRHRMCIATLKDGLTLMKKSSCDLSDSMTTSAKDAWARAETRRLEAIAIPASLLTASLEDAKMPHESKGAESTLPRTSSSPLDASNEPCVVVLPSRHDPKEAHCILAAHCTSKACLTDARPVRPGFGLGHGTTHFHIQ